VRVERGLVRLVDDGLRLEARGGEGLEDFYRRLGWQEIGRWPGAFRFDDGDRDEVLMLLAPL
jgi:hypothetical protein